MKIYLAVMIIIALIVIGLMIIFTVTKRKRTQTTNYRALFIVGLSFIPVSIATKNTRILILGLIFLLISLLNRKEWKNEKRWLGLTQTEKATRLLLMAVGIILLIAGVTLYYLKT